MDLCATVKLDAEIASSNIFNKNCGLDLIVSVDPTTTLNKNSHHASCVNISSSSQQHLYNFCVAFSTRPNKRRSPILVSYINLES